MLARELGLDYRLKRGIDLRADVSGIEAMQSVLLESFPDHVVHIDRRGRTSSAVTARSSARSSRGASTPSGSTSRRTSSGYWAMIVPPDTRVWPFGRVARLVAMGHKERDLVSYFLELAGRARAAAEP